METLHCRWKMKRLMVSAALLLDTVAIELSKMSRHVHLYTSHVAYFLVS